MNFFKRKFSFQDDDGCEATMDDSLSISTSQPPSAFSFHAIANKVSNTISAPTSPARTSETLAAAVERSLAMDRTHAQAAMPADARILLVIDGPLIDWGKYFRNPDDVPVRVEQADFPELDVLCTEHSWMVEINQAGRDSRSFCPDAIFIGSRRSPEVSKTIIRSLIAAGVPFLNSPRSVAAFLDKANLKKELRKISLPDGTRLPMLPTLHYPQFKKFHTANSFPLIVCVDESHSGMGKMKINCAEELSDLEGMLKVMNKPIEVEVEPFVEIKYDLHVQKIGKEFKTFIRRAISRHWKSNAGSSVLEQMNTSQRHKDYIRAVCSAVGDAQVISLDILVSREGREFIHNVNDVITFFGESQEDDRRNICAQLRRMLGSQGGMRHSMSRDVNNIDDFTPSSSTVSTPPQKISPPDVAPITVHQNGFSRPLATPNSTAYSTPNTPHAAPVMQQAPVRHPQVGIQQHQNLLQNQQRTSNIQPQQHVPRPAQIVTQDQRPQRSPSNQSIGNSTTPLASERRYHQEHPAQGAVPHQAVSRGRSSQGDPKEDNHSFAEDTMGQLKRTFAGIFGDVS